MAIDLALPTEVVSCPTVRESDGLALSSRNARLTPAERSAAGVLRRALLAGRAAWESGDESAESIRAAVAAELAREPLARPEYVSIADALSLAELERVDRPALLSLAVRFGETRLIDNELLAAG
jgi:pantoate--beta-alanine ligase